MNAQLKLRPPYRNGVFDRGGDQVLSTGATPLLVAAKSGNNEAVKLLLKYQPMRGSAQLRGRHAADGGGRHGPWLQSHPRALQDRRAGGGGVKLLQAAGASITGSTGTA